jgi:hypothetical protein
MKRAIMRLIFDGEDVRNKIDLQYVSYNRYQLVNKGSLILTKNSLKKYVIERMCQGENDDYDVPFDAFRISIGKIPENPVSGDWDLEGEIACEMVNIDITDDRDVRKLYIRLDIWLEIFEESFIN